MGPDMVRKWSGTTKTAVLGCVHNLMSVHGLGCQGHLCMAWGARGTRSYLTRPLAPLVFLMDFGSRCRSVPPNGRSLPPTIQQIQRGQGPAQSTAPAPQSVRMRSSGFFLAISLPFAHQERRTVAFVVGPSGLPYFLPHRRMDAMKKLAHGFYQHAYAHDHTPLRREPFHLGWIFDVATDWPLRAADWLRGRKLAHVK